MSEEEEKTAQELIHEAFEDIKRWMNEAETPEMKKYRMEVISEAMSGRRMQYPWRSIEQVSPWGNEEWDMGEEPRRSKP